MNNVINNNMLGLFQQKPRRPRQYRHHPSPLLDVCTDEEIRTRYRLGRDSIHFICDLLPDDLQRPTKRNHELSVETQVLATLRFLASGSFQQVVGDVLGIDKSSVSRVVTHFYEIRGFLSTIACVAGFHVPIAAPSNDENSFVNRKGWHSINVEDVSDAVNVFVDTVAKWPGSTHNSFILRTSNLHTYLKENHLRIDDGFILGDSGYALCRYLMTPYADPVTVPEKR